MNLLISLAQKHSVFLKMNRNSEIQIYFMYLISLYKPMSLLLTFDDPIQLYQ